MAILRAGPWGSLNGAHADRPTSFLSPASVYPVNCAKTDWASGAIWEAFYAATSDFNGVNAVESYGAAELGDNITVTGLNFYEVQTITFAFCYQATEDFDVSFNWFFGGTADFGTSSLWWDYETIEGATDSYFNTPAHSGTETITLPASTFCQFSVNIQGYIASSTYTVTASLS